MTTISVIINANKITGVVTEQEAIVGSTAKEYVAPKNIGTAGTTTGTQSGAVAEVIEKDYVVPKTTGTISTAIAIDGKPGLQISLSGVNEKSVPSLTIGQLVRNPLIISELIAFKLTFYRYYTDNAKVLDSFDRAVDYKRAYQENITISDLKPVFNIQPVVIDTVYLSELINKYIGSVQQNTVNTLETTFKNTSKILPTINANVISNNYKTVLLVPNQDLIQVTDISKRFVSFYRDFLDTINATDDYYGAANIDDDEYATFIKSLGDNIDVFDSVDKQINLLKPEEVSIGDGKFTNIKTPKTDNLQVLSVFNIKAVYRRLATEEINAQETVLITGKKVLKDTVNIAEQKFTSIKLLKTNSCSISDINTKSINTQYLDTNNISEFISKNTSSILTDITNTTDSVEKFISLLKLNAINTTDNFSRVVNYLQTLNDQINVSHDYLGNANIDDDQYVSFDKRVIDNIDVLEIFTKDLVRPATIDAINILDNNFISIQPVKINTSSISDTNVKNIQSAVTNNINNQDTFTRTVNYERDFLEGTITFIYSRLISENFDYLKLENGDFLTTEGYLSLVPGIEIDQLVSLNSNIFKADGTNIFDVYVKQVNKQLTDPINIPDDFNRTVNYLRNFSDQINARDDYLGNANIDDDQYLTFSKGVLDVVNFAENSYSSTNKILQDIINIVDPVYLDTSSIKADKVNFTEIVNVIRFATLLPIDTLYISGSITAYVQDYFENPGYVENGYTGTITTFI